MLERVSFMLLGKLLLQLMAFEFCVANGLSLFIYYWEKYLRGQSLSRVEWRGL
jgi:hypothetical protein